MADIESGRYSRRQVLGMMGAAGIGAAGLSACDVSTDSGGDGGGGNAGAGNTDVKLEFPDSGVKIPSEKLTFGWMDSGDLKAMFEEPFFRAYEKKHSNVTIDYQPSAWDRINEAIPLAVKNESAPDVFAVPNNVPVQVAVNEGWIQPIDDLIPDFEEWKSKFPPNAFINGVHIFNDKTYTWPMSGSKRYSYMLMVNPSHMQAAGVDPVSERLTWTSFREACKKVTEAGKGNYYGLLTSGAQLANIALGLAVAAGLPAIGGMNMKTGEYVYNADEVVEAFELLLAIRDDKSIFPGYLSLDDASARGQMPQGVAGMIFDGPWDIPKWPATNPDFKFDIAYPPTGDDKTEYTVPYNEQGANFAYVFAKSKYAEIAGDMFSYMGSLEGQINIVTLSEGNLASVMPEANEQANKSKNIDPLATKAIDIAETLLRIAPMAQVRDPESAKVILEMEPVSPSWVEIGEGIFSDQIGDVRKALTEFNDASEKNLDDAIAAAKKKGAQIDRDAWVFPNWDRNKDYTAADYETLPN